LKLIGGLDWIEGCFASIAIHFLKGVMIIFAS